MAGHRHGVVVLTERGRDLLESHRKERSGDREDRDRGGSDDDWRQRFYAELKKAREEPGHARTLGLSVCSRCLVNLLNTMSSGWRSVFAAPGGTWTYTLPIGHSARLACDRHADSSDESTTEPTLVLMWWFLQARWDIRMERLPRRRIDS